MEQESRKVEISKAVGYGWESVKKDFWYLVGLAVVSGAISSVASNRHSFFWGLVGIFLSTWMTCGSIKMFLSYRDGEKLPFGDLFNQLRFFWRVLGANLLLGLIIGIGLIIFIIPGIYLALRFQFTLPLIIDRDLGVFEAMAESSKMTAGIKWPLFGFALTLLGVMILGAIVFGIGVFIAAPVAYLAYLSVYRKLSKETKAEK